ncbi:Glutathione-dependent formaldehyde-activating enzyme, partial [Frankliniella fusca]
MKLLNLLHPLHPDHIPLSYKTLLETPLDVEITKLDGECLMWYKGIRTYLKSLDLREYLQIYNNRIQIDFNMDGLPLFKRSQKMFYPILGKIVGTDNQPLVIAIFFGGRDPTSEELLSEFDVELRDLQSNGYNSRGAVCEFKSRHFICNAPARAKVKAIVEHGGYCACEKCLVEGEWISNRMTYCIINAAPRTDVSFLNQEQPEHHRGVSVLLQVEDWGPVSQFRLDTLHLVYLGAYKRLLLTWKTWNGPWKLSVQQWQEISVRMDAQKDSCPSDINRPPRTFSDLSFWAGTEFRRSLMYEGVVVFKDTLNENIYANFLLLHCAMYILNSPIYYQTENELANDLLGQFITYSAQIYGNKFVVYNIHNLCHLADECRTHGPSDSFSSFPFENKLGFLKKSLRSGYKPLQQAANRDLEGLEQTVLISGQHGPARLANGHYVANEIIAGQHFKYLYLNNVELKLNHKDNCVKTKNWRIGEEISLVGRVFLSSQDLYLYPVPSSQLGILSVSNLNDNKQIFALHDIVSKCWLFPNDPLYACFPLFVVFKHKPDVADVNYDGEVYYDILLDTWITQLDDDMNGKILWPPENIDPGPVVRREKPPGDWCEKEIFVKRFYETYQLACQGCKNRINDTNYEIESEDAPRKRRKPARFESDSDDDKPVKQKPSKRMNKNTKKTLSSIPTPPVINFSKNLSLNPPQQGKQMQIVVQKREVTRTDKKTLSSAPSANKSSTITSAKTIEGEGDETSSSDTLANNPSSSTVSAGSSYLKEQRVQILNSIDERNKKIDTAQKKVLETLVDLKSSLPKTNRTAKTLDDNDNSYWENDFEDCEINQNKDCVQNSPIIENEDENVRCSTPEILDPGLDLSLSSSVFIASGAENSERTLQSVKKSTHMISPLTDANPLKSAKSRKSSFVH